MATLIIVFILISLYIMVEDFCRHYIVKNKVQINNKLVFRKLPMYVFYDDCGKSNPSSFKLYIKDLTKGEQHLLEDYHLISLAYHCWRYVL
jgi:hypothetical protein